MKQKKILNKIDYNNGMTNDTMVKAKKTKDDEFYTPLQEIADELSHYGDRLIGKNIICPCDWDIFADEDVFSIRVEFSKDREKCRFSRTYYINPVEKVEYSLWDEQHNSLSTPKVITGDEADELIKNRVTCNFLKYLCEIGEEYGVASITASGYDVDTNRGIRFQDVDYSNYDVCCTNPPFSIYGEFLNCILTESKRRKETDKPFDFIILAPFANRTTPCVGLPLMLKECYLGFGRHLNMNFVAPNQKNEYKHKLVACDWLTTFSDAQDEINKQEMHTGISYDLYKDDYEEMENMTMKDGTHPIRVENFRAIPDDYYGWIFASIGALDVLSTEEFEWYMTNAKGYFNSVNPSENPFAHKLDNVKMLTHNDKHKYHGIVLRRKAKN